MPQGEREHGTAECGGVFDLSCHSIIDNFAQMGWRSGERAIGAGGRRGVRRAPTLALNKSKPPATRPRRRGIIACEITRWILPPCSAPAPPAASPALPRRVFAGRNKLRNCAQDYRPKRIVSARLNQAAIIRQNDRRSTSRLTMPGRQIVKTGLGF